MPVRDFITEELWKTFKFVTQKIGGVYTGKVATEKHRFAASEEA